MRRYITTLILLSVISAALAACAEKGSATDVIEKYLRAKVSSDTDELVNLSCNAWEANAQNDATAFASVSAELEGLDCNEAGTDGEYTLVTCEGQINVEYDGETRNLPLNTTTYLAIEEDDEWKMCGEQQ